MPHNKMIKILITGFLLLSSNLVFAKWYQVEMVVFEHLAADTSSELWKSDNPPDYSNAINLETDSNSSNALDILSLE